MILEALSKRDKDWRYIAMSITKGNKNLSDDLVQDMYIKLMNRKKFNTYYVAVTLKHLYLDTFKNNNIVNIDNLDYINSHENTFEPNDEQRIILNKADNLDWYAKELLKESFDNSHRQIGKKYNIDYGFIHREIHKAIRIVLGSNYKELYKNSNLKYQKNER